MRRTRAARYMDCCDAYFTDRYATLRTTMHPAVAAIEAHCAARRHCKRHLGRFP